jgi:hypothetical protein
LIDFPEEFEAPPDDVLEQLREIDSAAELVCVSPGVWWAGRVMPFAERCEAGKAHLASLYRAGRSKNDPEWWPKIRNALLMSQGFGPVCKHRFTLGKVHWSELVEDFRYRLWWYDQYQKGDQDKRAEVEDALSGDWSASARARAIKALRADPAFLFKRIIQQNPAGVPVGVDL